MTEVREAWWRAGGLLVAAASFLAASAVALLAALLSLLLEDLLPIAGPRQLSVTRLGVAAAALVLLFGALVWRGRVHRRTGTLFYVRILDDVMPDLHTRALELARRRRMSLRSVTRWVDLPGKTTADGVIDVVAECEQVTSALEETINNDRDDTAYTLAPNLLWPMALAVGAGLPVVERLNLLELDTTSSGATETSYALPSSLDDCATVVSVKECEPGGASDQGRIGLLLAFAKAAAHMQPEKVFAGLGVTEHHRLGPVSVEPNPSEGSWRLDAAEVARLAACLPKEVANIKKAAGGRELVVAASMPKSLAVALGWGLALSECRFFANTHLLHYDQATDCYLPMRVHFAQPTHPPGVEVG